MSCVYFHTPSGDARLRGTERAYAACVVESLGAALLSPHAEALGFSHHLYREPGLLRVAMSDGKQIRVGGEMLDGWQVLLNTAIAAGSDPVRFLARMHAQCEIHGWVAGEDRAWLAGLIRDGLRDNIMRGDLRGHPTGWSDVVALLEASATEPVVMSYSVCEQFPSMSAWNPATGGKSTMYV